MASTKDYKNKIKSIVSIRKITKAMKMVAASKLRLAQRGLDSVKPYFYSVDNLFNEYRNTGTSTGNASTADTTINNTLIVTISSDRGLCGGINSTVSKATKVLATKNDALDTTKSIICVGIKAKDQLQRGYSKLIQLSITDLGRKRITFPNASIIAEEIFNSSYDVCYILYNKFKSVLTQQLIEDRLESKRLLENAYNEFNNYELEPSKSDVLYDFYEYYTGVKLYYALLENNTSEQGARMNAMENAAKNAAKAIDRFTLLYNKARQASITSELIEIISCASAVSSK